jgi:hypothetical protein
MRKKSQVCEGNGNLEFDISNLKWKVQVKGAGWKSFVPQGKPALQNANLHLRISTCHGLV